MKELSTLLRTKGNVDHAGLSLLLLPKRVINLSKEGIYSAYLSNNLLIAIKFPMDARVGSKDLLSTTTKFTLMALRLTIHTLVKTVHARKRASLVVLKYPLTRPLLHFQQLNLWLLLLRDQLLLQLRLTLILSKVTNLEL